jgi:hypothetical protein
MMPSLFPQANLLLGDDQPEYLLLPAHRAADGVFTTCWELDDQELEVVLKTKRIWSQQLTFGGPFQPQIILANEPELR